MRKIKQIKWVDSHYQSGWILNEDILPIESKIIESVGFVVDEDDNHIRIALNVEFDKEDNIVQACDLMTIPKCSILKIKQRGQK